MANIKLNGQSNIDNVTCFSYAPTILDITTSSNGTNTIYNLSFGTMSGFDTVTEYYIDINGTRLTRTDDISQESGYTFYMDNTNLGTLKSRMIYSLANAIKNVAEVISSYKVYIDNNVIKLKTYEKGNPAQLTITHNLPILTMTFSMGTSSSEFTEGSINIDIFKHRQPTKYNGTPNDDLEYLTTLSKHTSNDSEVRFDLSPILASETENGNVSQFGLRIYSTTENALTEIASYNSLYNINGYLINQGGEFIQRITNAKLAMNVSRGQQRTYTNNTILYIYDKEIYFSLFTPTETNIITYNVKYIGSDNTELISVQETATTPNPLSDIKINLSTTYLAKAKYIDIEFTSPSSLGTLRFNVIKPIKATDENQRVFWRNSYGGLSFFDFTGNRTEKRKITTTTYTDSILNYYNHKINEKNLIFDKQNEITVNLTTHNILKDTQWLLFDLQQSRDTWIYLNGEKYRILVSDLTITETNVTDIYTATIEYTYSMGVNV